MKWFRLYNETIHDRKLRRLPPAQRWLWIAILCAASDSPERGRLLLSDGEPVTIDDLVDMAALPLKTVKDGLAALERLGMVGHDGTVLMVAKWDDRQHKSDNSTDRWRKWKEQQGDDDEPTPDKQPTNVGTNVGKALDKPPANGSVRGYARPTETDTETESAKAHAQPVFEKPIEYVMALCEEMGQPFDEVSGSFKKKQCGIAANLAEQGYSVDQVRRCIRWLRTDDWWLNKGIDLQVVSGQIGKFEMSGEPHSMQTSPKAIRTEDVYERLA